MNQQSPISRATSTELLSVSADSHVVEPPELWPEYVDPAFRDRVPRIERTPDKGEIYVIEGYASTIPMMILGSAGLDRGKLKPTELHWRDYLRPGGWDAKVRLQNQAEDGLVAEMLYPSLAMALCSVGDLDYRHAMLWAYNRWLQDYVSAAPDRLFGLGLPAIRTVAEAVEEVTRLHEMGFRGVMLPGDPGPAEDYDHPSYDPLWARLVELDMPISFHVLTAGRRDASGQFHSTPPRGPRANVCMSMMRSVQDLIGMFIWGGVLERHRGLKLVCAEADAGWAPHYMFRIDRFYREHFATLELSATGRTPGRQFYDQVYLTFQEDKSAWDQIEHMNAERLLWANDFPHSDSTYPKSRQLLAAHAAGISEELRRKVTSQNVIDLYRLPVTVGGA